LTVSGYWSIVISQKKLWGDRYLPVQLFTILVIGMIIMDFVNL